jgi:hypothetical protein
METDLQTQIDTLKKDLKDLTEEMYRNNFSASQDFNKKSNFTTNLIIPKYNALPSTCDINEVVGVGGVLYICSSQNTWQKVGSQ